MTKDEIATLDAQLCEYRIETKTTVLCSDGRGTWGAAQDHATREADKIANPVTLIVQPIRADDVIFGRAEETRFTVVPSSWQVIDAKP
jgi:hypothetical protein